MKTSSYYYLVFFALYLGGSSWIIKLLFDESIIYHQFYIQILALLVLSGALIIFLMKQTVRHFQTYLDSGPDQQTLNRCKKQLFITFWGAICIVPLIAISVITIQGSAKEKNAYYQLQNLASPVSSQINFWITQREKEAANIARSTLLASEISRVIQRKQTLSSEKLLQLVQSALPMFSPVPMTLLDTKLNQSSAELNSFPINDQLIEASQSAQQTRRAVLHSDIDPITEQINLTWVIPIQLSAPSNSGAAAVLLMHLSLEKALFKMIRPWLNNENSIELMLVHNDPGQTRYLHRRKFEEDADYSRHFTNLDSQSPIASTLYNRLAGELNGYDYRNKYVFAYFRALEYTNWYLIAKINWTEAMAPFYLLTIGISLFTLAAIIIISWFTNRLWQQSITTQRLTMQAKTNEQDRLLRNFYDLPFVGMTISSPQSTQPFQINDYLCDLLGYTQSELKTIDWENLLHSDDQIKNGIKSQQLIQGEINSYSIDQRFIRKNGSLCYTRVDKKGIYAESGELKYIVSVIADLTEQTLLEHALRRRKAEYQMLFTAHPLPMWIYDHDSQRILEANNAAVDHYGYSRHAFQFMRMDQLRASQEQIPATESSNFSWYQTSDGSLIEAETFSHPIEFNGKQAIVLIARDMTQQRQDARELLLASTVFENTYEGVVITDSQARIIKTNKHFCNMFGYREGELIGQDHSLLRSDHHGEHFYQVSKEQLNREGYWQGEVWSRRKDDEVFPGLYSICAVYDDNNQLTNYVGIITDISHIKETEAKLEHQANHDTLTQLPNRRHLSTQVHHSLEKSKRSGYKVALLILDLDHFKDINDSYGHQAGDEVLQQVASRLRKRLRKTDTLARFGGDEFVIIVEELKSAEEVAYVADLIVRSLASPLILSDGLEVQTGTSVGISIYPDNGLNFEDLLQQADTALYHAKEQGRGNYSYYSDELTLATRNRLELENRLRVAYSKNEFQLYYQPQYDLKTGEMVGAEALIRWYCPERGIVSPTEFIPVAEKTGLIRSIGRWVLQEACQQGMTWLQEGYRFGAISVNISPTQLLRDDIVKTLIDILVKTRFPPEKLVLELTESALMENESTVQKILANLRELGVRLAIDDFGTGYSSLAYLKHFPLDVLKIDKSFINDIEHNKGDIAIAKTVITMGQSLGLSVLAEGIETEGQHALLNELGCEHFQGYLFSPPLKPRECSALMPRKIPKSKHHESDFKASETERPFFTSPRRINC